MIKKEIKKIVIVVLRNGKEMPFECDKVDFLNTAGFLILIKDKKEKARFFISVISGYYWEEE